MILNLRVNPRSIYEAKTRHADPLRVLRVVNHVAGWNRCSIALTKPAPEQTVLEFSFLAPSGSRVSALSCLDGAVPEVFDCDGLMVEEDGHRYGLDRPRRLLDPKGRFLRFDLCSTSVGTSADAARLSLKNYHDCFVPAEFTSTDRVVARLWTDTIIGSGNPAVGDRRMDVRVLSPHSQVLHRRGHNDRRRKESTVTTPTYRKVEVLRDINAFVDLFLWVDETKRHQPHLQIYSGGVPVGISSGRDARQRWVHSLRAPLDRPTTKHLGIGLEVSVPPEAILFDLDHSAVPTAEYFGVVDAVGDWLTSTVVEREASRFYEEVRRYRDVEVANRLLERQRRVQDGATVFVKRKPLLQEPQSENDVLALYFKLEGAGALPVPTCRVLEHTPGRDIDAVGHFRLSAADREHKFALIEFEHRFANFIRHGHSVRHVDLVICWMVGAADPLETTGQPWLMTYTDPVVNRTIPVLVLGQIPELEVRRG